MIQTAQAYDTDAVDRLSRYRTRSAKTSARAEKERATAAAASSTGARTSRAAAAAASAAPSTPIPAPCLEEICAPLKALPQWVVWDVVSADAAAGAPWRCDPINPATRERVRPTAAAGASFEAAAEALATGAYAGIGFILREEDPFAVITVEDAVASDGASLTQEAAFIVSRLGSYAELSPSGRDLNIFVRAVLPPGGRQRDGWQMMEAARFVPVTGRRWWGAPTQIADRQRDVEELHAEVFPGPPAPRRNRAAAPLTPERDDDILAAAFGAANGPRIHALFQGDPDAISALGGDRASADLALCSLLGFFTGDDPARVDRLYRRSALMRPKWDACKFSDGRTYGQAVVAKALSGCLLFHAYTRSAAAASAASAPAPETAPAPQPAASLVRQSAPKTASRDLTAPSPTAIQGAVVGAVTADALRLAEAQGRAQGLALRDQVLTAIEAAELLKISARLLRRSIRPWRRFGTSPAGDRWLLSELLG